MTGSGSTGDFATTDNPSVQNGGILLTSRVAILSSPMNGAAVFEQAMGGHISDATKELNRWKAMCITDGAKMAKWNGSLSPAGLLTLETIDVNYI